MDDSGFIVPPPGLIPSRPPADAGPGEHPPATVRPLPTFTPPAGPAGPAAPVRPVWRLLLPGGRSVPLTRPVLLGRNPSPSAHAGDADAIALEDPTSTVSKTHAVLVPDGDVLRVTDLYSTNGVVIGGERVPPGVETEVPAGSELRLGDLRVHVELA
ncbi:FHA domain-containing protein [Leifsonia virtsii]|uniref:FHA domain-containing protein n=1 Tax=Leifsonia virtsii TaxID=3035915 RepID=A0ABT8IUX1_9MICO|nr:FHA domain-containing protein [Leifsonia virtsii]MDN4596512.1 FHA domain-containing protein [Leifsonia virtsii]